jgi:hypothetical protein
MVYRALVVVCLLGVTAVAVYNSTLLVQSCAGVEICTSLVTKK